MNERSYEKMYIDHHNRRAAEKGMSPEALWGSSRSQQIRFRVMERVFLSKENFSILDIGCGLGDFYPFLISSGYQNVSYTGLELNEGFVGEAAKRYPDARFTCGNLASLQDGEAAPPVFDYVIASGIYNLGENPEPVLMRIRSDFEWIKQHMRIGYAVNFLSVMADTRDHMSLYYDPATMWSLFTTYFGRFGRLYHDYLPHDFTLIAHVAAIDPWG